MKIECPRCGNHDVTEFNLPNKSELREYKCNGDCQKEDGSMHQPDYTYFQYSRDSQEYSWPFTALWVLHEEDLKDYRNGKAKPRIC